MIVWLQLKVVGERDIDRGGGEEEEEITIIEKVRDKPNSRKAANNTTINRTQFAFWPFSER